MILRFHNQVSEVVTNDHQPKNNVQVILSHVYLPALDARKGTCQLSSTEINIPQADMAPTTASVFTPEPKVDIDFTCAAREILQVLRGELSQRELSKKLGYTFNQVGKWESGVTQIKWDDFLQVCKALNAPLERAFSNEFITPEPELTSLVTLKTLSNHFSAGIEQDKKTRASMKKWLSGNSAPDLAEVLKFMASRIALMLKWLSALIDCNQVPCLREANDLYFARSNAAFRNPNADLIYAALSLDAYQKLDHHDDHLLTTHTSCSLTQIRQIINDLHLNGFIQFDGKKYIPISHTETHSSQWETICQMTTMATQRYSVESPLSQQIPHMDFYFSVATSRVVPLSTQGSKTVRDLIWKYQSELLEVIKRDQLPKHHLLNIILHSYRSNTNAPEDPDFENV
jgi:DNA-binding transcriptional regulator YiaG